MASVPLYLPGLSLCALTLSLVALNRQLLTGLSLGSRTRFVASTMFSKACLAALALSHVANSASVTSYPIHLETRSELNSKAANIHVSIDRVVEDIISFTYGSCSDRRQADSHHLISRHAPSGTTDRLVWLIPEDAYSGGCVSAWSGEGVLLGRSKPQQIASQRSRKRGFEEIHKRSLVRKRDADSNAIPMTNATGIDAWGPWFDGVELLQSKNLSAVDVSAAKSKKIGIVGAGMSGLMTFLALKQAGFENLEIIEGGERLGGRVHTVYLSGGPFDYSYQGQYLNLRQKHEMTTRLTRREPRNGTHALSVAVDIIDKRDIQHHRSSARVPASC